jgi:hypothetical protein
MVGYQPPLWLAQLLQSSVPLALLRAQLDLTKGLIGKVGTRADTQQAITVPNMHVLVAHRAGYRLGGMAMCFSN